MTKLEFLNLGCYCCPVKWNAGMFSHSLSLKEATEFLNYYNDSQEEAPEEAVDESWICPECSCIESSFNRCLAQALEAGCEPEEAERLAREVGKTKKRVF